MGEPLRTCVGCGQRKPQRELVRLARVGEDVRLDPRRRMPGRGGYICGPRCVEGAVKRKGLGRAFRSKVRFDPAAIVTALEEQQAKRGVTLTSAEGKH